MRVLFSGAWNPAFEALPEYLVAALRQAGHEVTCFDHRSFRVPGRIRDRLPFLNRHDRRGIHRRLLRLARETRPHLVLVNQGAILDADALVAIREETGAVTVNWWSDYPAEFEVGLELASGPAYDRFYVSGTDAEHRHHEAGAVRTRWLPFACDPSVHRPDVFSAPSLAHPQDRVAFVGSAYPERRELVAALSDLGIAVWGPGWERYRDDPEIGHCIRGGALRPGDWTRVYANADVVLNVSYGFGGHAGRYGKLANVRVFEILGCGACQLVDAKDDILRLFRPDVHLVVFRSVPEARRLLEELLEDPSRRRRVALAGRQEVLRRHTWAHRVQALCEDLRESTGAGEQEIPA